MTRSKSSTIIFGFFRTLLSRLISYAKTVNPEPEHIQVSSTQLASDFFSLTPLQTMEHSHCYSKIMYGLLTPFYIFPKLIQ